MFGNKIISPTFGLWLNKLSLKNDFEPWIKSIVPFVLSLFFTILVGKTLSKTVTWTGVGAIDKSFGIIFGIFKGYVISVCIFSILNWFYPYKNWGISAEKAVSFEIINKGSEILIEEFPSSEDFIDTKEKIEKIW